MENDYRIVKYPVELTGRQTIAVIQDFIPLTAQLQNGVICIWGRANIKLGMKERKVWIFGTGQSIPEEFLKTSNFYFGTVQNEGFVWHVFMEVS